MPAALLKEQTPSPSHERAVHRVAHAHLSTVAADLRRLLLEDNTFQRWEADAIVDIVIDSLKNNERLGQSEWQNRLHSKGFPKDLARALGSKLSNK